MASKASKYKAQSQYKIALQVLDVLEGTQLMAADIWKAMKRQDGGEYALKTITTCLNRMARHDVLECVVIQHSTYYKVLDKHALRVDIFLPEDDMGDGQVGIQVSPGVMRYSSEAIEKKVAKWRKEQPKVKSAFKVDIGVGHSSLAGNSYPF